MVDAIDNMEYFHTFWSMDNRSLDDLAECLKIYRFFSKKDNLVRHRFLPFNPSFYSKSVFQKIMETIFGAEGVNLIWIKMLHPFEPFSKQLTINSQSDDIVLKLKSF